MAFLEKYRQNEREVLFKPTLKKLIQEQLSIYRRTNLVKSKVFSGKMSRLMNQYRNGQISNSEVIEELLKMLSSLQKIKKQEKNWDSILKKRLSMTPY